VLAAAAGFEPADDELEALSRAIASVRAFAASLHALDLDDVPPWTPPT
jgi:hypothetical protein